MKLVTAIVAGIGTCILVTVPVGLLAGFLFGSFRTAHYVSWAVFVIQMGSITVGVLAGRMVYRHLKKRSALAPGSSATELPLPAQQT
jgi:hypothetical protein